MRPKYTVIEQTALELAACTFEDGRSLGISAGSYKNARDFAKKNFVKFIPKAVEILMDMLCRDDLPELMRAEIYEAFQERLLDQQNDGFLHEGMEDNLYVKQEVASFVSRGTKQ